MFCCLLFCGLLIDRPASDASRILAAQQSQAMEVRAQHREVTNVQPDSHLTPAEEIQHAKLKEEPGKYPPAQEMIAALLADHEVLIRRLRIDLEACAEKYHDTGTNDFLTGLMEKHEKMAWMLRAFLAADSV